jgi:bacterioferritin-associated ferredoxin
MIASRFTNDQPSAQNSRPLCHCLRVSETAVRECVADGELACVRDVTKACGAGGGCMACHRHLKRIIAEHHAARTANAAQGAELATL